MRTSTLFQPLCLLGILASLPASAVETKTLFQVDAGIELENIAVRWNGNILATGISQPLLFQFDPTSDESLPTSVTIPGATSLFGIIEFSPDVFAVVAGNWTRGATLVPGTFSAWSVNFRSREPVVSKIVDFPQAAFLNGMTAIPRGRNNATLLITDTGIGKIYHVDPTTSNFTTVLAPGPGANITANPAEPQAGINGIRYNALSKTLYYTNTMKAAFCKVELSITPSKDGLPSINPAGPYTVIASRVPGDDFAIQPDGTAYIGANPVNTLFKVTPGGNVTVVAGGMNETAVAGATSAAFGRTKADRTVLYVSANGLPPMVANATSQGGKVVAVELSEPVLGCAA
ncbi:hypothetical protein IFR05_005545 [Cadophora sp. M221]|nr:hypothetical protein IFR05_005545 [Cadophora sp. M221]